MFPFASNHESTLGSNTLIIEFGSEVTKHGTAYASIPWTFPTLIHGSWLNGLHEPGNGTIEIVSRMPGFIQTDVPYALKFAFEAGEPKSSELLVILGQVVHPPITRALVILANGVYRSHADALGSYFKKIIPDLHVVPSAPLCLMSSSQDYRQRSGIIIDFGAGETSIVPIYDDHADPRQFKSSSVAGQTITKLILKLMMPSYIQQRICTSATHKTILTNILSHALKERRGNVSLDFEKELHQVGYHSIKDSTDAFRSQHEDRNSFIHILPMDLVNQIVDTRNNLARYNIEESQDPLSEIGFYRLPNSPSIPEQQLGEIPLSESVELPNISYTLQPTIACEAYFHPDICGSSEKSIAVLLFECISEMDEKIRPLLCDNIILCGGGARIPGLLPRLQMEMHRLMPNSNFDFRIHPRAEIAAWTGGQTAFKEHWENHDSIVQDLFPVD